MAPAQSYMTLRARRPFGYCGYLIAPGDLVTVPSTDAARLRFERKCEHVLSANVRGLLYATVRPGREYFFHHRDDGQVHVKCVSR